MKINPSIDVVNGGKAGDAKATDRSGTRSATTAPTPSSPGSDRVQLSELSSQLAALETSLAAPDVDRARVESIKQAIREGRVSVNAQVVADRMLSSALAMLQKDRG